MTKVVSVRQGPTLSFHDIEYAVSLAWTRRLKTGGPFRLRILQGITGECRSGELTAILGPTGSGKSSLLDVLAGRKRRENLGSSSLVLLNGQVRGDDFLHCGYCEQSNALLGTLTVRETLLFSADLRLPERVGMETKKKRVEDVIKELGLEKCADSFIGTELIRGISGGELKRTSLGRELVTDPSLIFLDEPTTGLDAQTAGIVVDILARLAARGKTIILSIHQPKYSIFKTFQSVILLTDGAMAYQGAPDRAIDYFQRLGYHLEAFNNPADWFLEILVDASSPTNSPSSTMEAENIETDSEDMDHLKNDHVEVTMLEESKALDLADVAEEGLASNVVSIVRRRKSLAETYRDSPEYQELHRELEVIKAREHGEGQQQRSQDKTAASSCIITKRRQHEKISFATSFWTQVKVLSRRTLISNVRNPESACMQFGAMFFFVAMIGGIYWQMDLGPTGLQNRASFLLIMMCMFSNLSALELFIKERAIFLNEKAGGFYRTSAYFIARSLCDIVPLRLIPGIIFCSVVYWMMGLRSGTSHFLIFTITVVMTMLTSAALCLLLSSLVPIFAVANLAVALIFILFMVTGGVLINFHQLPSWLIPLKYISIFRYAMETLSTNELTGLHFDCQQSMGDMQGACVSDGDAYLALQHYPALNELWKNVVIIISMFLIYMILTYLVLRRLKVDS